LSIRSYLGASDYIKNRHDKLDGSCQWIEEREDYKDWRDAAPELDQGKKYEPSVYWITANPGAGKTVLVAHVESQLEEFGLQHGAFYFNFGKKDSSSLAGLLRSLAYQMAQSNAAVREMLMKLHNEASTIDLEDVLAIWSKIFRTGILQVSFHANRLPHLSIFPKSYSLTTHLQIPILTPQYWLIDALDECVAYSEFFSLLKGMSVAFSLKIFITSRKLADMPKLVRQLKDVTLRVVEIPVQDTLRDIGLYISSRMDDMPIQNGHDANELMDQIIAKSNASFLWVRLVMDELEGLYGHESMMEALQGIPEGMVPYYRRTVTEMAENKRERRVAKAILRWVALASRPLSTLELANAISIDVNTQLLSPKSAVEGLCGQLVSIDAESDQVRIIHTTAREFLASDDAGDFRISSPEDHEKIALVCLELLSGPEMQPPKHRKLLEHKRQRPPAKVPALLQYAISHFSDHILGASASSAELLTALTKFLSSNTLTWIERVATNGDIHLLVRTARNLKSYLLRRPQPGSSLDQNLAYLDSWATDLGRLAFKFHSALATYPESIYFLIPPLCPTGSAIHRQFRRMHDSLALLGPMNQYWEDCMATLAFGDQTVSAVACGESLIAVGFESGDIAFYNNRSEETELVLFHDLAMDLLQFDPQGLYIAGSNRCFLMVWDLQGNLLWQTRIRVRFFVLLFSSTNLLGVTRQGKAIKWDIETGKLVDERIFIYQPPKDDNASCGMHTRAPSAASVSPNLELIALAYRNGPVCLFDFETADFIGWVLDAKRRCPQYLIFHPNPDVNLLLIIDNESHLSLFDPWTGALVKEREPGEYIVPISATCSPSGHTFATVDARGHLKIRDFESLAVLYHAVTPNPSFRMLQFTSDNFNLLDVTNHEMKIWSPTTLMGKKVPEEASNSNQPQDVIVQKHQFETLQMSRIRTFTAHPKHPVLFVGKNNGNVSLYNLADGQEVGVLYRHLDSVYGIASCRENVIATSDVFNIVQVWTLTIRRPCTIQAEKLKMKFRATASIHQLLLDDSGEYLLVSTTQSDVVYRTSNGMTVGSLHWEEEKRTSWKWITVPDNGQGSVFALIHNHTLSHYTPSNFPKMSPVPPVSLEYTTDEGFKEASMDLAFLNPSTRHLVLQYSQESRHTSHSSVAMFQLPPAINATLPPLPPPPISALPLVLFPAIKYAMGFTSPGERFVFLTEDSWMCSIPLDGDDSRYTRHFFVPNEYTTKNNEIMPIQATGDNFLFCIFDKIAVIKNGLKFQDLVNVETS